MSAGAKDVLIKSVAQALPTYTMGMFKMSDKFCEEYSQLVRNSGGDMIKERGKFTGFLGRS